MSRISKHKIPHLAIARTERQKGGGEVRKDRKKVVEVLKGKNRIVQTQKKCEAQSLAF